MQQVQHHVLCSIMCSGSRPATSQTRDTQAAQHHSRNLLLAVQHKHWCMAMRTCLRNLSIQKLHLGVVCFHLPHVLQQVRPLSLLCAATKKAPTQSNKCNSMNLSA